MIRLVLTADQTAAIVAQADGNSHRGRVFAVASPGSWPDAPGLLVLNLIECPNMQAAADACDVALGNKRATKLRTKQSS